ncbi:MAG: hypothetical protein IJM43_02040 [Bacteroidaceae bacterium]|nr:hypothetical protein [Bacteroidaceae bacterium]
MKKTILPLLMALLMLSACDQSKREAQALLDRAQELYANHKLEEAIQLIDSIGVLYPKAYEVRHAANRLGYDVTRSQLQRDVTFIDSVLTEKQAELDKMLPEYTYERDTAYQQTGRYLWPTQVIEKNTSRSYLRAQVEENGQMSLTSIYVSARPIHHTAVKVMAPDGTYVQTPASIDSYETTNLGLTIEKADYGQEEDGGVAEFVAQHASQNLTMEFIGDRTQKVTLTPADRKAIQEVLELANRLSLVRQLKENQEENHRKIEFVERKMAEFDNN